MAAGNVITGVEGVVSLDAQEIEVTQFTITTTGGTLDTTDGGSGEWRSKLPGKRKMWTGTVEVFMKVAEGDLVANTTIAFIGTAETTLGTKTYTGSASITEIVETVPVEAEEAAKVTFNIEGLGALTIVNTAP